MIFQMEKQNRLVRKKTKANNEPEDSEVEINTG